MSGRTKLTPKFGAYGFFKLLPPFATETNLSYRCEAVRSFRDVEESGLSVYKEFYETKGISVSDYESDLALGPNIITLVSDSGLILYVPDTYILSIPKIDVADYKHFVFSIDVGMCHSFTSFDDFENALKELSNQMLGIDTAKVVQHVVPVKENLTLEQARLLEASRLNNRSRDSSIYAQKKALEEEVDRLRQTVDALSYKLTGQDNPS